MEKITLTGQVPAKKNSRVLTVMGGRLRSFPNSTYTKWERDVLKQLKAYNKNPLDSVWITYTFFNRDLVQRDNDNMMASVNDMLKKAGIIKEDNWLVVSSRGVESFLDRTNPRVELIIEPDETPKTLDKSSKRMVRSQSTES